MKKQTSQRELCRYQTSGLGFAALHSTKVGRIIDISPENLSFRYYHDASRTGVDTQKVINVSLFHENGFTLRKLPCRIISDESLLTEYKFNQVRMYKCQLRFEGLTAQQKSQLDLFISHCVNINDEALAGVRKAEELFQS